jgi:hypothetical protein
MSHADRVGSFVLSFGRAALLLIGCLGLGSGGCGATRSDAPNLAPVSGVVTMDGRPVPNAIVAFNPPGGQSSFGPTDSEGRYRLSYIDNLEGAAVGQHVVSITTRTEGPDSIGKKDPIPARYNEKSELKADVKPGPNELNFDLVSKEPGSR